MVVLIQSNICAHAANSEELLQIKIKSINRQIKEAKTEYKDSMRKIKIKRHLLIHRLDKKSPLYKSKLQDINIKYIEGTKSLRSDWRKTYNDLIRKRQEAIKRYKLIKKSLDKYERK
jgi:hypothetical protein